MQFKELLEFEPESTFEPTPSFMTFHNHRIRTPPLRAPHPSNLINPLSMHFLWKNGFTRQRATAPKNTRTSKVTQK